MAENRIALISLSVLGLTATITIALAQNTSNPIKSGTTAAGRGVRALTITYYARTQLRNRRVDPALLRGRTKMKNFVLSIVLSALASVAICGTTQAAYYHHRHHHYWRHGGYPTAGFWNYYRTSWPGRGTDEESTR